MFCFGYKCSFIFYRVQYTAPGYLTSEWKLSVAFFFQIMEKKKAVQKRNLYGQRTV